MDLERVRTAYSSRSAEYIDLFDGDESLHEVDAAVIRKHLGTGQDSVLDLGCGPGQWTGYLHRLGVRATGVDIVPDFVDHARAHHPGPQFRLGSMCDVDLPPNSVSGILSWYSTIHTAPPELDAVLSEFRRLLVPSGTLVLGFFASDDDVAAFGHAVLTAYRWPVNSLSQRLAKAGLVEVERVQRQVTAHPDRTYAALAARAD